MKFGYSIILEGESTCPPEGGLGGYEEFLELVVSISRNEDMVTWGKSMLYQDKFNIEEINKLMKKDS